MRLTLAFLRLNSKSKGYYLYRKDTISHWKTKDGLETAVLHSHLFYINNVFTLTIKLQKCQFPAPNRYIWIYWSKRQWVAVASAGLYTSLHFIPDNHANIPPLSFYRLDALPAAQPTASKHWRQKLLTLLTVICLSVVAVLNRQQLGRLPLHSGSRGLG